MYLVDLAVCFVVLLVTWILVCFCGFGVLLCDLFVGSFLCVAVSLIWMQVCVFG